MGVVIAGAGSIGLLLGSYLSASGIDVTMFVRRKDQASLLSKGGIRRINGDGSESVFGVHAETDIEKIPKPRLWIIAVKYSNLRELLKQLDNANVKEPMLFVQNGIGHIALTDATNLPHIAFATVEHGALRIDDRTVKHNGIGMVTIGVRRGDSTMFSIVEKAKSATFPITQHEDAEHILMRKVIINCMINPLTAILEVENGELLTNRSCYELFESLYGELMTAFPEMRLVLPLEKVSSVCRNTARNRSSMLTDRSAGRPMEIETIVTAVIAKAHSLQKSVPLLSTFEKMLYAIDRKERDQ